MSAPALPGGPLVDVAWLAAHLGHPRVVVADLRWRLGHGADRAAYDAGHVPGARFVDLDRDLASPPGPAGRHPLPRVEQVADMLARLGVGAGHVVVAYDDARGSIAARLWWVLRWLGHDAVRLLDGGLAAWTAAGHALEQVEPPPAARVTPPALAPDAARLVDRAHVKARLGDAGTRLVDARAAERFEGKSEPVDARAGHVPGAANAPWTGNLDADGRFLPREALAARYAGLGALDAPEIVAYCGSGVTACHALVALALAGRHDARLYVGSWSEWAGDPGLPCETGPGVGRP